MYVLLQVIEMHQKAKEDTEFKAKDASVLYKAPFAPLKFGQPMIEMSNFVLHTELRSEQRAKFDTEREQREQQREQENREKEVLTEALMAKEVAKLRRDIVHKPLPIQQYAPTVIRPSSRPLTTPQSPNFSLTLRGLH